MRLHISRKDMSMTMYCGLDAPQMLECTPMRESHHVPCDWSRIATCRSCARNRTIDIEKQLKELEAELRVRKFQKNL